MRHLLGKESRKRSMELHDIVDSDNRLPGCGPLAASIGINGHIRGQQRLQLVHVAAAGRREERSGDLKTALPGHMKAGARRADMSPRAARKLTACGRLASDRLCDLLEAHAEHVVEKKGRPFQ